MPQERYGETVPVVSYLHVSKHGVVVESG